MRILYPFLSLLILVSLLSTSKVKACHYAAADIYVTYIGSGVDGCGTPDYKYEVTLIVYYACQTCYLDQGISETVWYKSPNLGLQGSPDSSGSIEVTDVTADAGTGAPDTSHQLCAAFADSNSCKQLSTILA